ncbi:MAG: hypothetical protein PVH29_06265 [Candidatus Zixiibacteriota bacterium]|jgi:hypothetical protein
MPRTVARAAVLAALLCTTSCLNIVDVVQPAEVEAGEKFEVALQLRTGRQSTSAEVVARFAGVVAVSLPEGAAVVKAGYEGGAKGKFKHVKDAGATYLPDRPGYTWSYWITVDSYEPLQVTGKDYAVKLTLRAPDTPGDYELAYAAGAAHADGREINYAAVIWASPLKGETEQPMLERGITVK